MWWEEEEGKEIVECGDAVLTLVPVVLASFNLKTSSWKTIGPAPNSFVPSGRCFHSATVVGNSLYVFGGTLEFQQNIRSNEMFR